MPAARPVEVAASTACQGQCSEWPPRLRRCRPKWRGLPRQLQEGGLLGSSHAGLTQHTLCTPLCAPHPLAAPRPDTPRCPGLPASGVLFKVGAAVTAGDVPGPPGSSGQCLRVTGHHVPGRGSGDRSGLMWWRMPGSPLSPAPGPSLSRCDSPAPLWLRPIRVIKMKVIKAIGNLLITCHHCTRHSGAVPL